MEKWRDVPNTNGLYQASDAGRIRRKETEHVISTRISNSGYKMATISIGGKAMTVYPHRLVAAAFVPNPSGKREVNHIDGNKFNNSAENLEWVTPKENMKHARESGLFNPTPSKKCREAAAEWHRKKVIRSDGAIFGSIEDAAKSTNCSPVSVSGALHGRIKKLKGYKFSFVD